MEEGGSQVLHGGVQESITREGQSTEVAQREE